MLSLDDQVGVLLGGDSGSRTDFETERIVVQGSSSFLNRDVIIIIMMIIIIIIITIIIIFFFHVCTTR